MLLVGEESAGIQALRRLAASGHHVVAVMASPSPDAKTATLWNVAQRLKYPTWPAELVQQPAFAARVVEHRVDLLLNVHSLYLIDAAVLNACRVGAFNMHPGPLPQYAGLNAPSWAIYHGETEHAVTIHAIVPRIDAGHIAYQRQFAIEPADTGLSLMSKCVRAGVPLLSQFLEAAASGPQCIPRISQDLSRRRYFDRRPPNNGRLDWHRSARDVVNHVRAADYSPFVSPWGHPRTCLEGDDVGIVKAWVTEHAADKPPGTVRRSDDGGIFVAATDRWVAVRTIEHNGRYVAAREFVQELLV